MPGRVAQAVARLTQESEVPGLVTYFNFMSVLSLIQDGQLSLLEKIYVHLENPGWCDGAG